jgi:hypothetical protein
MPSGKASQVGFPMRLCKCLQNRQKYQSPLESHEEESKSSFIANFLNPFGFYGEKPLRQDSMISSPGEIMVIISIPILLWASLCDKVGRYLTERQIFAGVSLIGYKRWSWLPLLQALLNMAIEERRFLHFFYSPD